LFGAVWERRPHHTHCPTGQLPCATNIGPSDSACGEVAFRMLVLRALQTIYRMRRCTWSAQIAAVHYSIVTRSFSRTTVVGWYYSLVLCLEPHNSAIPGLCACSSSCTVHHICQTRKFPCITYTECESVHITRAGCLVWSAVPVRRVSRLLLPATARTLSVLYSFSWFYRHPRQHMHCSSRTVQQQPHPREVSL